MTTAFCIDALEEAIKHMERLKYLILIRVHSLPVMFLQVYRKPMIQ
jgi:hypothetical protein